MPENSTLDRDADAFERLSEMNVTPDFAKAQLLHLGYTEDLWDYLIETERASHDVRALIPIARSTADYVNINDVYARNYPEKMSITPDDVLASHLADIAMQGSGWDNFLADAPETKPKRLFGRK